ncbi:chorismate mutase/5-enolpyruvylshikimate-3-phosphate synthase [Desulfobaculum xiamenense]|uniref:chorismate mutase n=1 Tax=Desulfobaculum xiamenense TaxID=995050 RepID=A0A846QKV7_9BACT|nr:chorismate mutase [Desulfobaculum xiamenense]NJB68818.1 chorismate mutase/5-enolpyruvylshikimate-3-phosphate synthase [Desulfobaculum xiamenense]
MNEKKYDKKFSRRDGESREARPAARDQWSITEELVDIDRQLTRILARRTTLLAKAAGSRKRKGKSLVDPSQEKSMRAVWEELVKRQGFDATTVRKLFNLSNGLAYGYAQADEQGEKAFIMRPRRETLSLDMPGPRALVETRMWAALAAAAGVECTLEPVVLNDPIVELVKALNQAGASISREKGVVRCTGAVPDFSGKTVFAGSDELNFYMMLAMAMPEPGISMFSGGTPLKVMDLRPVIHVLSGLGIRLTTLEPQSNGVPVRMESGGMTTNRFRVPEGFPAEAAAAMALFGPTFPDGIEFTWGSDWNDGGLLGRVAAVLKECGIPCTLTEDSFSVARARYAMPKAPRLALDPMLCTTLLAAPHFGSGKVRLAGVWPADNAVAMAAVELLKALGMRVEVGKDAIVSELGERPEQLDLDVTVCPRFAPLALAAGFASRSGARVAVGEGFDSAAAMELGERLGRFVRVSPDKLVVAAAPRGSMWEEGASWVSPAPEWSLGLALASYAAPGIVLANPGDLAALWPEFWQLFVNGFTPKIEKKEPDDDGDKKGRRVRIG